MSASAHPANRHIGLGLATAVFWLVAMPAQAESSNAPVSDRGLMAAQTCAGCHGTQGYIEHSAYVPLAGMPREQFINAMRSFADGSRPSTLMGPLARAFKEHEIAAMADYFSSLPKERAGETNTQGGDDS